MLLHSSEDKKHVHEVALIPIYLHHINRRFSSSNLAWSYKIPNHWVIFRVPCFWGLFFFEVGGCFSVFYLFSSIRCIYLVPGKEKAVIGLILSKGLISNWMTFSTDWVQGHKEKKMLTKVKGFPTLKSRFFLFKDGSRVSGFYQSGRNHLGGVIYRYLPKKKKKRNPRYDARTNAT